jgi:CBS domain-containing protein
MNVQTVMSSPVMTCRPSDNLDVPAKVMWDQDCGVVPVTNDDGEIVGMVTDRDICMAALLRGSSLSEIPVSSAMADEVFSCKEEDSLAAVERLMREHQIRRVPVVDSDNHAIGIVTLNDIARQAASARTTNGLDREITQTLAAIGRGRPRMQTSEEVQGEQAAKKSKPAASQPAATR